MEELPDRVFGPAMRLDSLMRRYPITSIDAVDRQADTSVYVGILNFFRMSPMPLQNQLTIQFKSDLLVGWTIGMSAGMATGATTGSVTGAIIGGPPGAFLGGLFGMIIGGVLGLVLGISCTGLVTHIHVVTDRRYKLWIEMEKSNARYNVYVDYMRVYFPDCNEFFCPITHDFPIIPSRCPNGFIYDFEAITQHLDRCEDRIARTISSMREQGCAQHEIDEEVRVLKAHVCPSRGPYYTKAQLVHEPQFAITLRQKLVDFISNRDDILPHIRIGLEALITSLKLSHNVILSQKIAALSRHMNQYGLTQAQQTRMIAQLLD